MFVRPSYLVVALAAVLGCSAVACAGGGEQDLNPQPLPPGNTSSGEIYGPAAPITNGDDKGEGDVVVDDPSGGSSSGATGGTTSSSGNAASSGSSGTSGTSGAASSSGGNTTSSGGSSGSSGTSSGDAGAR